MKTNIYKSIMAIGTLMIVINCGSIQGTANESSLTGSDSSNTSLETSASTALASVFSGGSSSTASLVNGVKKYLAKNAMGDQGPSVTTCLWLDAGPSQIDISGEIEPGTYGSASDPISVDKSQGCTVDGIENPDGEFASFDGESHELKCKDSEGNSFGVLMENFSGVYKDSTDEENISHTEIFGSFTLTPTENSDPIQQETIDADCSMTIVGGEGNGGGLFSGGCTNSLTGEEFETDTAIECEGAGEYEDSEYNEGQEYDGPQGSDEEYEEYKEYEEYEDQQS